MGNELALTEKPTFSLAPRDLVQALEFADRLAKSTLVPKEFQGNPGNILVAVQWGMELGLQPMQAMQNIAVINGRPSLWGDAVIGLVKASPVCEYVIEEVTDEVATCRVKRRGEVEQVRAFSKHDARTAGLLSKQGPWTSYPKRMMQMRARSWALRDVFPDVLRGMPIAEEVMDIPLEKDITPKRQTGAEVAAAAAIVPETENSKERENLIADMETIAHDGLDAYKTAFAALSPQNRKLLGATEHERLKKIATEISEVKPSE